MNATSRTIGLVMAVLLPLAATAALPEGVFTYSGYLRSGGGAPETTAQTVSFALYDVESGGTALWSQTLSVAPDAQGWFSAVLGGAGHALPPAQLASQLWLGIKVASEPEMAPRTKVGTAPLALAVDWGGVLNRPAACASGQFVTGYDPGTGAALCATPAATGGVSSVSGSGFVTAAPTTGAVTVSLSGCGSAGQILQWSGTAWQCVAVPAGGGVTSVGAAAPLVSSGGASPVVSLTTGCGSGQLLKWGGAAWGCADDANAGGTITGVSAGSGLSGGGSSGAVSLAVNLAGAGGTNGTATTVARSDHAHSGYLPYAGGDVAIAGRYAFSSAKTGYYSLSAAALIGEGIVRHVGYGEAYLQPGTTQAWAVWPVNLPQGATVTDWSCTLRDNDAGRIDASLQRNAGQTDQSLATVTTNGLTASAATQTRVASSISNPVIDNASYGYYAVVFLTGSQNTPNLEINGCRITYTVTGLSP